MPGQRRVYSGFLLKNDSVLAPGFHKELGGLLYAALCMVKLSYGTAVIIIRIEGCFTLRLGPFWPSALDF